MRYLLTSSVTLFFAVPAHANDTALAQAANAIRPAVEAATSYNQKAILQSWVAGKGPTADGKRSRRSSARSASTTVALAAPCKSASSRVA